MAEDLRHVSLTISGDVQAVGFRYFARAAARSMGVRGLIRNQPDGAVYCEAEGAPDAVARFIEWCRKGPPTARVERVDVEERDPAGFSSFEIE
jgi:acylphosphatase